MRPLFVRLGAALLYLFIAALVYLAGVYVARIFYFLYLLLLFLPLFSILQLVTTIFGLRYYQDFDTEHPVKGQSIAYRLSMANELILASCVVQVRFKAIHPDLSGELTDFSRIFRGRESLKESYQISCPYRGIYTVGLEAFIVRGLLGWLEVRLPVYHRTFYVYPRIVEVEPRFAGSRSFGVSRLNRGGRERDFALFEGLTEYRAGLPVRHLAWKKYYSTGSPFLKEFATSAEPGLTLYLDLRRTVDPTPIELAAEDCSIEIAVALVKYFLDNGMPISVKTTGAAGYGFSASTPEAFRTFYRDTITLTFGRGVSPASLFQSDRKRSGFEGAVLLISHLLDPEILALIEGTTEQPVGAILNQTAMSADSRARLRTFAEHSGAAGRNLFIVRNPETIREDLE